MNTRILDEMLDCYEAGDSKSNFRLNQLLKEHEAERRQFLLALMDEDLIADELKVEQIQSLYLSTPETRSNFTKKEKNIRWLYPAVAAAAILCAVIAIGLHFLPETTSVTDTPSLTNPSTREAPIATLIASTPDAVWSVAPLDGSIFQKKTYQLSAGSAHLKFSNDVQLSMDAPAVIEIKDAFQVFVKQGKVRAQVPESGHGFRIHTPDIAIKDLGTEFGVDVAKDQDTKVHVFNGEIELYPNSQNDPFLAKEGYSAKWVKGKSEEYVLAKEEDFPTYKSITLKQWKAFKRKTMLDSSLLLSLNFRQGKGIIPARTEKAAPAISENPLKVRGRWYKNSAYVIDSIDQAIKLPDFQIQGDFTIQAWINLDTFESSQSVIMNTQQFGEGRFHWQIERTGRVKVGFGKAKRISKHASKFVQLGQWNHVAITFNSEKQILRSYLNGDLIESFQRTQPILDLSESYIGAWNINKKSNHEPRLLHGKIDEFSIHQRTFNRKELTREYRIGTPNRAR